MAVPLTPFAQRRSHYTPFTSVMESAKQVTFRTWITLPKTSNPLGKYLFKVRKITLQKHLNEPYFSVILLTLNGYLPTT